jgi:PST family polysaccharide transporter
MDSVSVTGEQDRPQSAASRRTAVNGGVYLAITQVSRLILTTISAIVLARLLSPDDYGVVAMAAPVLSFIMMFQDLGLSAATIQRPTVSQTQSAALFWINVSASVALALLLLAISPLVAWFYGDPRPAWITAASGLVMLVTGIRLQHAALLDRDLRFGIACATEIVSALVTLIASLIAAYLMQSYWALFIGSLSGALVQTVMIWSASAFRPGWRPRWRGAGDMLRFGGHITGFNLVNFFVRNADNVLIAKFAGASALGLYDRSYKLMMLPIHSINAPVSRLLLPLLSRLRDDPARYRRTYLLALRMVLLASVPGIAIVTALSDRVMPFLLGERWAATAPIFFWLGLTGLVQPVANLNGVLFMSAGRTKVMAQIGLASAFVTLIGFAIGLRWGAEGVAASLFVTVIIRLPFLFVLAARGTSVSALDLTRAQVEPLVGAGIAVAAALVLSPHLELVPLLIVTIPLSYTLSLASSSVTPDGRELTIAMLKIAGDVLRSVSAKLKRPAQPSPGTP